MKHLSRIIPFAGVGIFVFLFYIVFLVLGIYCTVLFIKLAHRGITALDIYISKNSFNSGPYNTQYNTSQNNDNKNEG